MLKGNRGEWSEVYAFLRILADGEIIGGLMLLSRDSGASMGEVDQKVAETTTSIIARQMEQ